MRHHSVLLLLFVWLIIAIFVGRSGILYAVPPPIIGGTNFTLVLLLLLAFWLVPGFRTWIMGIDLRALVLYHLVRFVGIVFLFYYALDKLPREFALPAGWGDIAVALAAIIMVIEFMPVTTRTRWWAVLVWNIAGLLDIIYVLGTGIRLGLADLNQMIEISAFPLNLLPTFIVPLIFATHIFIFVRLAALDKEWSSTENKA
jgi:hypothetical protein